MTAVEDRITKILVEDFKVRAEDLEAGATLRDLGFDSLVIVELSLSLDNEFGVELGDGELTDAMSVAEAAELLLAKGVSP
jgi:acyl carrier protein